MIGFGSLKNMFLTAASGRVATSSGAGLVF